MAHTVKGKCEYRTYRKMYEMMNCLGQGVFGEVFEAKAIGSDAIQGTVAIKVRARRMRPSGHPEGLNHFRAPCREAS